MKVRKVLYVTGTRADFGLMASTLRAIHQQLELELCIAVTGMHLLESCGLTVREVEETGLPICERIPTGLGGRTASAMANAVGEIILGLTVVLQREKPDIVLLLGDRGEMLAGAIAAAHLGIPVVHIHGGERSGTIDESIRHAISKLSHWHFVATTESRERLVKMGEHPDQVHVTGAPGLDGLDSVVPARREVLEGLGLGAEEHYALVLFHPVVQEADDAGNQTAALLASITSVLPETGTQAIWLNPNADAGSAEIVTTLNAAKVVVIPHMTRQQYLGVLLHADVLIGNSSSGIIEAASFGTPVLNIGSRQNARERNSNTIDVQGSESHITAGLRRAIAHGRYSPANKYGDGKTGARIVKLLAELPLDSDLLNKVNTY